MPPVFGPGVAVEGALVRPGRRRTAALVVAVAQREQRADLAVQELLDHHPRAGRAEAAAERVVDGRLGRRPGPAR